MITVRNCRTRESRSYSDPPWHAVVRAYAEEHGDWNPSAYDEVTYQHLVTVSRTGRTIWCGDWGAYLEN